MSHTPGPWTDIGDPTGEGTPHYHEIHPATQDYFTEASPDGFSVTGYMKDSDARLIAAAPDLLAALESAEAQLSIDYPGASREKYWPTIAPVIEQARAAIKKAKGL